MEPRQRAARPAADDALRLWHRLFWIADGGERRRDFDHHPYGLRQADPQCGRHFVGRRRADHDCRRDRLYTRRPAASGRVAAALARLCVADRTRRDRSGRELRCAVRRTSRAPAAAPHARNRVRLFPARGVAALPGELVLICHSGARLQAAGLESITTIRPDNTARNSCWTSGYRFRTCRCAAIRNDKSWISVQQQPVAAHVPALQPIAEAHAEKTRLELA